MSKLLNDVQPSAILTAAALNAVSEVYAWGDYEKGGFNITSGAGTCAIETSLTESGPFKQLSTFTDAAMVDTDGAVFRLKVTAGGPLTVTGQAFRRGR